MELQHVISNYPRSPETQYRAKPVDMWLRCMPTFVVILVILSFAHIGGITDFNWILSLTIAGYMGLLPLLLILCRVYPIKISAAGLRSFNGFGVYSQIAWDQLQQRSNLNIFGWRYFRFKRPGMLVAILIPLDLDDRAQFTIQVARYLGADHPTVAKLCKAWKLPPVTTQAIEASDYKVTE